MFCLSLCVHVPTRTESFLRILVLIPPLCTATQRCPVNSSPANRSRKGREATFQACRSYGVSSVVVPILQMMNQAQRGTDLPRAEQLITREAASCVQARLNPEFGCADARCRVGDRHWSKSVCVLCSG